MYVVMAGTGHVGSTLVQTQLARGEAEPHTQTTAVSIGSDFEQQSDAIRSRTTPEACIRASASRS